MRIDLGRGTVLETAVQADVDYVEENFRAGERAEHEALGGGRTQVGIFETCWTVRHGDETIGYCGVMIPPGMTAFAPVRWLCYMSSTDADRHKLEYVRRSRDVLRAIVGETPEHVAAFLSLPAAAYEMSVKWHERVLRMRRMKTLVLGGQEFVLFRITRKEVQE